MLFLHIGTCAPAYPVACREGRHWPRQDNHLHIQEVCPTREQFPLPTLGPKLEAAMVEVQTGRGFYFLRCAG